jgi:hypothetical protein
MNSERVIGYSFIIHHPSPVAVMNELRNFWLRLWLGVWDLPVGPVEPVR